MIVFGLVVLTAAVIYFVVWIKRRTFIETSILNKERFTVWDDGEISVYSSGPVRSRHFKGAFLPASFSVEYDGKVLYIDPFGLGEAAPASFILITHCHPDHYSRKDIERIYDEGTIMICPKNVSKRLAGFHVIPIQPGEVVETGNIRVEAVPAYTKGFPTHPKRDRNVGYILTIGSFTLYHSGDTDYVDELDEIKSITLALVPIKGGNRTMSTNDAVELVNRIRPKAAMAMHYILDDSEQKAFADGVDEGIEVVSYKRDGI